MTATIIDGRKVALEIKESLRSRVEALPRPPGLGVVLASSDPASEVYVDSKTRSADDLGIRHETRRLDEPTEEAVLETVHAYNDRDDVDAILVQLPLADGVDEDRVLAGVDPAKDVDGFHPANLGRLLAGSPSVVPCTPAGILELLDRYDVELAGAEAVVVGRSRIVGRPLAALLSLRGTDATVTLCHSKTRDLSDHTRRADLLVSAVGSPGLITGEMVREGATVIDVGINRVDDELVGDVDLDAVRDKAGKVTPVPGGVGPMTVAMLLRNTVLLAERRHSSSEEP